MSVDASGSEPPEPIVHLVRSLDHINTRPRSWIGCRIVAVGSPGCRGEFVLDVGIFESTS